MYDRRIELFANYCRSLHLRWSSELETPSQVDVCIRERSPNGKNDEAELATSSVLIKFQNEAG